jgi:hypothetical protein
MYDCMYTINDIYNMKSESCLCATSGHSPWVLLIRGFFFSQVTGEEMEISERCRKLGEHIKSKRTQPVASSASSMSKTLGHKKDEKCHLSLSGETTDRSFF